MTIKTVRLDPQSEALLAELVERTGMNPSQALKAGLVALREALRTERSGRPYEIYRGIDLGPGGYARAPARWAKSAVREIIRSKHQR